MNWLFHLSLFYSFVVFFTSKILRVIGKNITSNRAIFQFCDNKFNNGSILINFFSRTLNVVVYTQNFSNMTRVQVDSVLPNCYYSKTICMILFKLIPYICYEILYFTQFLFFLLIPTVSYWACSTWYVSSVTPLSTNSDSRPCKNFCCKNWNWEANSCWDSNLLDG